VWLGERPGWVTLIGGAIVVVGVVLTNTRGRQCENTAAQPINKS
jgi:drug/metabolite transporter (DMT)-like permease